jgi:Cu(I)/Ag(I) efflux system membrane fusion protein
MKTKMFLFSILFAASSMALLANCSGKKEHDHDHHAMDEDTSSAQTSETASVSTVTYTTDPAFQKQLASVFASYVALKDAFVASDAAKVKTAAADTEKSLAGVDMKLLKGVEHNDWMTYSASIEKSLKEIQATSDIEEQRKTFSTLSDALYKSVKAFGLGGVKAYYEFCPMALDGGAYWLSNEEKIRNPYFGDKMLTCGSVKERL